MKKLMTAIIVLAAFSSCSNYYKAITTTNPATANSIEDLKMKHKYFILRDSTQAYAMSNISITADRKSIQCNLDSLPEEHIVHLTKGISGKMDYVKTKDAYGNEEDVLNEVHLFTTPNSHAAIGPFTMPLSNVQKTEIPEKDITRTRKSHTKGAIIAVGASVLAVGAILAIVGSNLTF